jgi:hypothetical protein
MDIRRIIRLLTYTPKISEYEQKKRQPTPHTHERKEKGSQQRNTKEKRSTEGSITMNAVL